jgi:hypothetical protein
MPMVKPVYYLLIIIYVCNLEICCLLKKYNLLLNLLAAKLLPVLQTKIKAGLSPTSYALQQAFKSIRDILDKDLNRLWPRESEYTSTESYSFAAVLMARLIRTYIWWSGKKVLLINFWYDFYLYYCPTLCFMPGPELEFVLLWSENINFLYLSGYLC